MRHPDIAPCHCRTSQGATRQHRTLRLSHIAPCDIALSHLATFACRTLQLKKPAFDPLKPLFPPPYRRSARTAASQNPTSAPLSACGVRLGQRASCPLRCEWKSGKVEEWNGGKVERLGTTPLLHHSLPHQWGPCGVLWAHCELQRAARHDLPIADNAALNASSVRLDIRHMPVFRGEVPCDDFKGAPVP